MNVSATSRSNSTKLYLKHHLVGGLITLGFEPGRIGTLVSMATDSSHRVIMEKTCGHSSARIFDRIFFILSGNTRTAIKSRQSSNLGQIGPRAAELAALERFEKFP